MQGRSKKKKHILERANSDERLLTTEWNKINFQDDLDCDIDDNGRNIFSGSQM